jgi:hypothetical protein
MAWGLQQSPGTSNTTVETLLEAIAGLVTEPFDSVEVTYTDSTKNSLDTALFKNGGVTVATITATYPSATQETYTRT